MAATISKRLDAIDRFIAQNKLACDFTSLIEAKTVKPNTFIDYIQAANATDAAYRDNATTKAYKYYQVATIRRRSIIIWQTYYPIISTMQIL